MSGRIFTMAEEQCMFEDYARTPGGAPKAMANWTEDAAGDHKLRPYRFQFTFLVNAQTRMQTVQYLQKGSFGAAFMVREILPGDSGHFGETFCAKFFHTEDEDADKEREKLQALVNRERPEDDKTHSVAVVSFQSARLSANPEHPGSHGIVLMEFAALGEPLDYVGVAPYGVEEPVLRRLIGDLFAGVGAMHAKEIFHRDLKPENLVIGADGKLKLCDYGGAKVLTSANANQVATRIGVGSCMFNAPELQTGDYSKAVDIWSCGVVALVLRTCKIPDAYPNPRDFSPASPRPQTISNFAGEVFTGRGCGAGLDAHLARDTFGALSPELDALLRAIFVGAAERLALGDIAAHPWFAAGETASDLQLAEWFVHRNAPKVRGAIAVTAGRTMMASSPTFYGSLCGVVARADPSVDNLLVMLGLDDTLLPKMREDGINSIGDLRDVEPDALDEWELTAAEKVYFTAAAVATGQAPGLQ